MKRIEYKNRTRIIIIEPTDKVDDVYIKFRGEHADLFCVPIEHCLDEKLYYHILPNISLGNEFYGGIMYYNSLEFLDKLLRPLTYTMDEIPISKYEGWKALISLKKEKDVKKILSTLLKII